jgi:hypothetical protein
MYNGNSQTMEDGLAADLRQAARRCLHGEISVEEYVIASNRLRRFIFEKRKHDEAADPDSTTNFEVS